MFIDVTRYGGMRVQRVAVAAIAYLDTVQGGCGIHLIGGETLRVNEDLEQIEKRVSAVIMPPMIETAEQVVEDSPPAPAPMPVVAPPVANHAANRHRGRNGR